MELTKIIQPFVFTIFGATGDLPKIKIFPSLYELASQRRFKTEYVIIGYGRTKMSTQEFRSVVEKSIRNADKHIEEEILTQLLARVEYVEGAYDKTEGYTKLFDLIEKKDFKCNEKPQFVAYYSVPPEVFDDISRSLQHYREKYSVKLVIEKPFGENEKSARNMCGLLEELFDEKEVYLLDHFLGKESVQSILSMRYGNAIINHLLKGELIKYIQITAFENYGIKDRGRYFDKVGIIKDMVQSHLLQLLALITMSMPNTLNAQSIHREKNHILCALQFMKDDYVITGQYEGYLNEKDVRENSSTETYASMKLHIDQTEWSKVPIYIRTGKMMDKKKTYITIVFKKLHFQESIEGLKHNKLIIEIQPEPNLYFKLTNKRGGSYSEYHQVAPRESLECFGDDCLPEHGRLLLDVLKGERMHFVTTNEIIACWEFIDKVLEEKNKSSATNTMYKIGTKAVEDSTDVIWHEI